MRIFSSKPHKIITTLTLVSVVLVSFFVLATNTNAAPNYQMNYQGKLTNASNVAVADGTYNMRFWLLTTSSIATTSAVWTESLTGTNKVQVTNGLFSVMLGSTSPLTSVDFNQTLYLGVEIGGTSTAAWDGEMSPRKILGTVPAAFEADRLDGLTSTQFVRTDATSTIASSSPETILSIVQNGVGDILNLFDGATEVFSVIDGGNVGIGSTTPSRKLTVQGGDAWFGGNLTATGTATFANLLATGSSTIGGGTGATGLTINGTATTTNLKITSLTPSRALFTGADNLLTTTGISQYLIDAITDETGTGSLVFSTNPLLAGFRSNASSTIGDGTGAGGLTVFGRSTTTGIAYFAGNVGIATPTPSFALTVGAGQIAAPDGTGGAPSYSFINDPDTGILSSGANAISLYTGGTVGLFVNTSGFRFASGRNFADSGTGNAFLKFTNTNAVANSATNHFEIFNAATSTVSSAGRPVFAATGPDTNIDMVFSPKGAGMVGIGSTTPSRFLTIGGGDSWFSNNITAASSTITHASSTALTATNLYGSVSTLGFASSTALTVSGTSYLTNLLATGSSTIGGGTGATGLTINGTATTTNLKITSLTASRALFTGADNLLTTTGLSQYLIDSLSDETGTGSLVFSTNPLLAGFRSNASSTIGDGTQTGGLTINGGATTTLNAYFGGTLSLGSTSPSAKLTVVGTAGAGAIFRLASSTGVSLLALDSRGVLTFGTSTEVNIFINGGPTSTPFTDTSIISNNVAIGNQAFSYASTTFTARDNIALGYRALYGSSTRPMSGVENIAIGRTSLSSITSGNYNVSVGSGSLLNNTSGVGNVVTGASSLGSNRTGNYNIAQGYSALVSNVTGNQNIAIGDQGLLTSTGSLNVGIGTSNGSSLTTGNANTFLGSYTSISNGTFSTSTAIGAYATVGCSNCMALGGIGANSVNVGIGTTTPSRTLTVNGDIYGANLTATGTATFANLLATGSSTIGGGTGATGLTVNGTATTTNLKITSLTPSRALFTGADNLLTTTGISQYLIDSLSDETGTGSLVFSTNPLLAGFRSNASSTIGDGTQTGGLTINGGATTTLNAYFGGTLSLGSTSPSAKLTVVGTAGASDIFRFASSTGASLLSLDSRGVLTFGTTTTADIFINGGSPTQNPQRNANNIGIGAQTIVHASSTALAQYNIAIGIQALLGSSTVPMTGDHNVAIGVSALAGNASGTNNVAIGSLALTANSIGYNNSGVGYSALTANTTGYENAGLGMAALQANTTGYRNSALGYASMLSNTIGTDNTASGWGSLAFNISGIQNSAFGVQAMFQSTGSYNTAQGYNSLAAVGSGNANTASGWQSLVVNTSGTGNTGTGYSALGGNTTGSLNTALGMNAGITNMTGSSNTYLGFAADGSASGFSTSTAIGAKAVVGCSNCMVLGGTGVDFVNVGIGTTTPSRRLTIAGGDAWIGGNLTATGTATFANLLATGSSTIGGGTGVTGLTINGSATTTGGSVILGGALKVINGAGNTYALRNDSILFARSDFPNSFQNKITNSFSGVPANTSMNFELTNTAGSGHVAALSLFGTGDALFGRNVGLGTTTPTAFLTIGTTTLSGSTVGGIKQYLGFINSTQDAVYYGDETYISNAPTATSTLVGSMIRIADTSALGNTVRGFEAQAFRGTNTKGENTGLSGFGRTFGVRGTTLGDAGDTFLPAGVFAETQGTTQGNALRAYSGTITTEELVSLFHDTSNFTGTGLQMNFGNAGGSFAATSTAKFLDLQVAGTSKFMIAANGSTTIGDGVVSASLRIPFGGICVDNDGSCVSTTTGQIRAVTSALGNSDLAEMYFSNQSLHAGEIVALSGGLSIKRAGEETEENIIGVVSTKPGLTLGFDDTSLIAGENAYPIGLKGRVPIKLSTENGPIKKGDRIALSSIPGVGMKATESSRVVGIALEDYDGTRAYTEGFLNQFGDDMYKEKIVATQTVDMRSQDGCSNGGGNALGEEACVAQEVKSIKLPTLKTDTTREDALRAFARESALKTTSVNGEVAYVGQAIMFIELTNYQIAGETRVLSELASSTLLLNAHEGETVWSRIKTLAQNFVDGVLSVTGIKADRVEVKNELCVDGVCVTADDLRAILQNAHQAPQNVTPPQTNTGGGGGGEASVDPGTSSSPPSTEGTTGEGGGTTEPAPPVSGDAPVPPAPSTESPPAPEPTPPEPRPNPEPPAPESPPSQ